MKADPLEQLINMMQALRSPNRGCPWDRKQTYQSLTPHTLEETHEVIAAIELNQTESLKDELGDLLFQIVFYAQIADEENKFDLTDVIEHLVEKMQRRHPHVFGDKEFSNEEELKLHWEKIKKSEQQSTASDQDFTSVLDNVPQSMPALARSQKLQNRASKTGFDWNDLSRVKEKLDEEILELNQAIADDDKKNIQHEIGDIITACVNLARHLDVDAEQALRLANLRFTNRFNYIEEHFFKSNKDILASSLEELETLWQQAKDHLQDY